MSHKMGPSHIRGGEWNKKFLNYFEVLAIVFELKKEMSKRKCNMRLSRVARIRRRVHTRATAAACRKEEGGVSSPVITVLCISSHRAYTIQKYYF